MDGSLPSYFSVRPHRQLPDKNQGTAYAEHLRDQFMGFPFADRLGRSPRAKAPLFLSLAKDWTQNLGGPLASQ